MVRRVRFDFKQPPQQPHSSECKQISFQILPNQRASTAHDPATCVDVCEFVKMRNRTSGCNDPSNLQEFVRRPLDRVPEVKVKSNVLVTQSHKGDLSLHTTL